MYKKFEQRINTLSKEQQQMLLNGGLKGLEKEGLRVTPNGSIAKTPHSDGLGSSLTHPYVTTDYSEALLELITPPFSELSETLGFLDDVHHFVHENLGDELFWAASMPCVLSGDESIPIAEYGTSNVGQMKHVYRKGLDHRYGRAMQAIAGVHFNYSIPDAFWPVFQNIEKNKQTQTRFISESYMGLIRNFQRVGWIVSYLFGASPAVCKSFMQLRTREFEEFDAGTFYERYATSLRMSDIGYKNSNQGGIRVSYNSLDEYVACLTKAIKTSWPDYEAIGVFEDGEYRQLNTNILQIENEYYSFVRPKQIAYSGEKPTTALRRRGIRYVEIRALDVNPFDPLGVNEQQLLFMEVLLLFCLLKESPSIEEHEWEGIEANQTRVACCGRDPELTLDNAGASVPVKNWASELLEAMLPVAEMLDLDRDEPIYSKAVHAQQEKVNHPEGLPSSLILEEMRSNKESFFEFAMRKSVEQKINYRDRPVPVQRFKQLEELARQSLSEQLALEEGRSQTFEKYLENYFASD